MGQRSNSFEFRHLWMLAGSSMFLQFQALLDPVLIILCTVGSVNVPEISGTQDLVHHLFCSLNVPEFQVLSDLSFAGSVFLKFQTLLNPGVQIWLQNKQQK